MSSLHARCGFACVLGSPRLFAFSGTSRVYERARLFVLTHLALDVELDIDAHAIVGVATIDVERIDRAATELALDAVDFDIREVAFVDTKSSRVKFVYDGQTLRVPVLRERKRARIR